MIVNQPMFGVFFCWWMDFLKRLDVWVLKLSGFIPKVLWSQCCLIWKNNMFTGLLMLCYRNPGKFLMDGDCHDG